MMLPGMRLDTRRKIRMATTVIAPSSVTVPDAVPA